jgi:hypothetical protein
MVIGGFSFAGDNESKQWQMFHAFIIDSRAGRNNRRPLFLIATEVISSQKLLAHIQSSASLRAVRQRQIASHTEQGGVAGNNGNSSP